MRVDSAVQCKIKSTGLLFAIVALTFVLDHSIGSFVLFLLLMIVGAWRMSQRIYGVPSRVDTMLLTLTISCAWIAVIGECASLIYQFGNPVAWLTGAAILSTLSIWDPPRSKGTRSELWSWVPQNWIGRLVLMALLVQLCLLFFTTFFTGINISDSVTEYLPRSIRFIQNGSLSVYETHNDYLPAFHQVLVSILILFLRSDVLVVPMSFLTGIAASLAVFAFARSLRWRGHLPLGAALVLWTMPAFLLHASTPNFDILTGLWLVLSLYFLRRGYAATDLRWISAAALATGLGIATKLTFAFALPALAVVWFATFARALLRGRRRRSAQLVAAAVIAVSAIGLPFLVRNVVVQGYLLGPPQLEAYISGNLSPAERVRALAFNVFALGFELVTPPFLLPPERADRLNDSFVWRAAALGFTLPDPKLTSAVDVKSIIRHALPEHRYDSNHASFGAAFVLAILPSMLAVGFARRPLGAHWPFAMACLVTWLTYLGTYGLAYLYQTSSMRFLIEPMIVVAVISPTWLSLLPRQSTAVLLVMLAIPLIAETKDVIANSRWAPPTQVIQTPRVDQISVFAGAPPNDAARELDRKYPPRLVPEIYVDDAGTGHPYFPDYTFLGPTLQRRARYWVGRSGVVPPGPLLTNDPNVATILLDAGMLPDRLSADVWLLLPNDRLRVRVAVVQPTPGEGPILRMVASVPPEQYRVPEFAFFQVSKDSTTMLRQYAEEPLFDLPLTFENRQRAIRIAVRDASFPQHAETVELDRAYLLGL